MQQKVLNVVAVNFISSTIEHYVTFFEGVLIIKTRQVFLSFGKWDQNRSALI